MNVPIAVFAFGFLSISTHATDVSFESSDGLWTDSTVEIKGRDFRSILWYFEAYKLKHNRPEVTLVRITPKPKLAKSHPKWAVPLASSSGYAKRYGGVYSPEERDEIHRRADRAHESWNARSNESRTKRGWTTRYTP